MKNKAFLALAILGIVLVSGCVQQQSVENGTGTAISAITNVTPKITCYSNPSVTLTGIVSNFHSDGEGTKAFILTLSNGTKIQTYIPGQCVGQGGGCSFSYIGYMPKDGDNVLVTGSLYAEKPINSAICPSPYLSAINIVKE